MIIRTYSTAELKTHTKTLTGLEMTDLLCDPKWACYAGNDNFLLLLGDAITEFGFERVAIHLDISTVTLRRWLKTPHLISILSRYGTAYLLSYIRCRFRMDAERNMTKGVNLAAP